MNIITAAAVWYLGTGEHPKLESKCLLTWMLFRLEMDGGIRRQHLKGRFLIGRGVGDNKSPAICTLSSNGTPFKREHKIELKMMPLILFWIVGRNRVRSDIEHFCKTQQIRIYAWLPIPPLI